MFILNNGVIKDADNPDRLDSFDGRLALLRDHWVIHVGDTFAIRRENELIEIYVREYLNGQDSLRCALSFNVSRFEELVSLLNTFVAMKGAFC